MFVDQVKIHVQAGKGGDGIVSFRHEKYVAYGGPFGGDGGNGGSVIFQADPGMTTLLDLRYHRKIKATPGEKGKNKKMHGANGEDKIVKVPLGTIVKREDTGQIIADLTESHQQQVIAKGGKGGRGNYHFKSSRNTAPKYAELGTLGEEFDCIVELRVLADVGLVGFPSVGKSTLLDAVSRAKPEIGDYPFTTISPNVGVVQTRDGRSFIMADLPGLIEGASTGKGLGHQFLRHIERCRVIVHVVDMGAEEGRDPLEDYKIINDELGSYQIRLLERPQIVVANKMDLEHAEENLKRFKEAYPDVKIIILTTFDDDDFVFSALKFGASGYLLKGVSMDGLYQAILTVVSGGAMINPDIATKVFRLFSKMANTNYAINVNDDNVRELNKPEWKVIQQVGFGLSNKEIAQKLFLSEGTVRNYLSSILSKLELRDRTQLAIWAVQTGQTTKDLDDD